NGKRVSDSATTCTRGENGCGRFQPILIRTTPLSRRSFTVVLTPGFRAFFPPRVRSKIRLDEIDWGGVLVNGIPPLRSPRTISAAEASWLRDGHIVFGILVNGQARAYPKRILAWHGMATDRLGGVDLTIVYCTLCGTVIPYESRAGGRPFTFGTSGLRRR